jgi:hypothetical protein
MSQNLIVKLQKISDRNRDLVTAAVAKIAEHHKMGWDGGLMTSGEHICLIAHKDGKDEVYFVWTVNAAPVIYFLIPATPGNWDTIGVNTHGDEKGQFGRRDGKICRIAVK